MYAVGHNYLLKFTTEHKLLMLVIISEMEQLGQGDPDIYFKLHMLSSQPEFLSCCPISDPLTFLIKMPSKK